MTLPPNNFSPVPSVPETSRGLRRLPGWVVGGVLLLLVVSIILRTAFATRASGSQDETESIEKTFGAVQLTKIAYAMTRMPDIGTPSLRSNRLSPRVQYADDSIEAWRKLANSSYAHTADWRRLALTLTLFNRPGATEALSHIAAARTVDALRLAGEKSRSARRRRAAAAEVPVAEEVALWKALYGPEPVAADHVAALRTVIGRLNLGWFEHAALAQLYSRASQKAQAMAEADAAYRSASLIVGYSSFQVSLILLGSLGLLVCGLLFVLERTSKRKPAPNYPTSGSGGPPVYCVPYAPHLSSIPLPDVPPLPMPGAVETPTFAPSVLAAPLAPALDFSYRARTIAFSVYLAVFMLIGLPLRLLRPMLENWSSGAMMRLNTILEIVVYFPVVLIAIWVLRRLSALESPTRTVPTWRATFAALGMTSKNPLADIGWGAFGYVLIMPLFFALTAFSQKLFQHYHTPINPVQFDSMMAQDNIDRLLLLIVTAVGAPVVEELMFRGLLYPALKKPWGVAGGALVSGAVFAIIHPTIPAGFLPIMLLGVAFAFTYERRGSLLPNIVMHALHNGLILLTVFFLFAR